MRAATANVTEDPNQTTHLMVSISPEAVTQRCSLRRLQLYQKRDSSTGVFL